MKIRIISIALLLYASLLSAKCIELYTMDRWAKDSIDVDIANRKVLLDKKIVEKNRIQRLSKIYTNINIDNSSNIESIQKRNSTLDIDIGMQFPLFGSKESLEKVLILSKYDVKTSKIYRESRLRNSQKMIRISYVNYLINQEKLKLTDALLINMKLNQNILHKRMLDGMIFTSDEINLDAIYSLLTRDKAVIETLIEDNIQNLRFYTGHKIKKFTAYLPNIDIENITEKYILKRIYSYPKIHIYENNYKAYMNLLATNPSRIESSYLDIGLGGKSNLNNLYSTSVYAKLHMSLPVAMNEYAENKKVKLMSNIRFIQSKLKREKLIYKNLTKHNFGWLKSRKKNLLFSDIHLEAAQKSYKEILYRTEIYTDNAFPKVIKAKYELYKSSIIYLNGYKDLYMAKIELLGLVKSKIKKTGNHYKINNIANIANLLSKKIIVRNHKFLGFYSWYGIKTYKLIGDMFFLNLPKFGHIFLSLNGEEIKSIIDIPKEKERFENFIQAFKVRDISISLLLADPSWIEKENQNKLIKIINSLQNYKFESIELDIEKSGLSNEKKILWEDGIVRLTTELRKHTQTPIGVTTNYKNCTDKLLQELKNAGVDSVTIMYYTINQKKIIDYMSKKLVSNKNIKLNLAQSIESYNVVNNDESYRLYGKKKAINIWMDIYNNLEKYQNFGSIMIQSLSDYRKSKR